MYRQLLPLERCEALAGAAQEACKAEADARLEAARTAAERLDRS